LVFELVNENEAAVCKKYLERIKKSVI